MSYTYALFAFGMVTTQAFNGAGDTATPTWINFVSSWLIQLPAAWLLAFELEWGVSGVFAAIALAQAILALMGTWLFRRGGWKVKRV